MSNSFKDMFNKSRNASEDQFEGKTNEEQRKLEMQVCEPDTLPKHTGKKPVRNPLHDRIVKLIFSSTKEVELFSRHFKVLTYLENNAHEISMLIDFLNLLESGKLEYDKENRDFIYHGDDN